MMVVNYSFQKNLKEQARKKKQEEKRLLKLNKKLAKSKESTPETIINQDGV
jgi:mRNA-degrading endonuclease YafQ of YafQ-DinJ toxin-antitoxin module